MTENSSSEPIMSPFAPATPPFDNAFPPNLSDVEGSTASFSEITQAMPADVQGSILPKNTRKRSATVSNLSSVSQYAPGSSASPLDAYMHLGAPPNPPPYSSLTFSQDPAGRPQPLNIYATRRAPSVNLRPLAPSIPRSVSDASVFGSKAAPPPKRPPPPGLSGRSASRAVKVSSSHPTAPTSSSAPPRSTSSEMHNHHAPGPNSIIIPHDIAMKITYADFQENEFLNREEWDNRYPRNLDPPAGLATLRCLFCDKQYAGPNARSMWRRHVGGKHELELSGCKTNGKIKATPVDENNPNMSVSDKRDRMLAAKKRYAQRKRVQKMGTETSNLGEVTEDADTVDVEKSWDMSMDGPEISLSPTEGHDDAFGRDMYDALQDVPQNLSRSPSPSPPSPLFRRARSDSVLHLPQFVLPEQSAAEAHESMRSLLHSPFEELPSMDYSFSSQDPDGQFPDDVFVPNAPLSPAKPNGMKSSVKHSLLPGITLAPPLKGPRKESSTYHLLAPPLPILPGSGRHPPSSPIFSFSPTKSRHSFREPQTPDVSSSSGHEFSPGSATSSVSKLRHPMPEVERRRWMLALDSPDTRASPQKQGKKPALGGISRFQLTPVMPRWKSGSGRQGLHGSSPIQSSPYAEDDFMGFVKTHRESSSSSSSLHADALAIFQESPVLKRGRTEYDLSNARAWPVPPSPGDDGDDSYSSFEAWDASPLRKRVRAEQ